MLLDGQGPSNAATSENTIIDIFKKALYGNITIKLDRVNRADSAFSILKLVSLALYMIIFYLCICVVARQTIGNIVFEVLLPLPFQKYSTCNVYLQI